MMPTIIAITFSNDLFVPEFNIPNTITPRTMAIRAVGIAALLKTAMPSKTVSTNIPINPRIAPKMIMIRAMVRNNETDG